jgi:hypothetical protein
VWAGSSYSSMIASIGLERTDVDRLGLGQGLLGVQISSTALAAAMTSGLPL